MHSICQVDFLSSLNGLKIFLSKIHLNNLLTKPEDTQLIYCYKLYVKSTKQDEDTVIKVEFTLSKTTLHVNMPYLILVVLNDEVFVCIHHILGIFILFVWVLLSHKPCNLNSR